MNNECKSCKFWTRHNIGTCSQKMLTLDNMFVNIQTVSSYGCNVYEHDLKKLDVRFWQDENKIHHSGTTSNQSIKDIIEYLQQKLKDNK